MNIITLLIINVFLGVAGQALIKLGVQKVGSFTTMPMGDFIFKSLLSPSVLGGLFLYFVSLLLWLMVLSKTELSVAYPTLSLGYVFVVFIGYFLFGEPLTIAKIAGILLICSGIYVIFR